ncbi:MAG: hypothetical protein U5O39_04365 [Gammaproteobacteria bacterium]|nr:hypothetical protein [Gammaproteobacteria bacterium]
MQTVLAKTAPSFVILVLDIICLNLLMTASGGVASGLGNFLIFTVAFRGGLILGRVVDGAARRSPSS